MPSMSNPALELVVTDGFNYFNYFTEVEEAFVCLRGAPMLISPLDWSIVESWKNMGIPLHVVLRGINKSLGNYNPDLNRGKRVNTILYCHQEVIANFKDYVESQVGGSIGEEPRGQSAVFPRKELIDFINCRRKELQQARVRAFEQGCCNLKEVLGRASARLADIAGELESAMTLNTEALEQDLTLLEEMIYEGLRRDASQSELEKLSAEAESQLRPHKKRMETEMYKQTLENYIAKRLRELHFIPRLSLFYML